MLAGVRRGVPALLVLALLGGCSSDDSGAERLPLENALPQVTEVIDRLERATQSRDFVTICDRLLTMQARERAGGSDCDELLLSTTADVRRPEIRVLSIRVDADSAEVQVRSTAEEQDPIKETIRLIREGGGYRIAALEG